MKRTSAVAVVAAFPASARAPAAEAGPVDALRRHLGGGLAREHVVLDFLEDDLRDARASLAGMAAWLANVERALSDATPSEQQLLALAASGTAGERIDALASAVASVRRRLAQVAARM